MKRRLFLSACLFLVATSGCGYSTSAVSTPRRATYRSRMVHVDPPSPAPAQTASAEADRLAQPVRADIEPPKPKGSE
jgi:hypothetical protein